MLEKDKDLFGDFGDLDLGSDFGKDFADFTPIDDGSDMSAVFDDEKKADENPPEQITGEAPTAVEPAEQKEEASAPAKKENVVEVKEEKGTEQKEQSSVEVKAEQTPKAAEELDLFDQVVAQAETKQAESVKSGLTDKLPIFSYANAKEEIADTSKTFDQLRNEKAEDFPELDDGTSVSWKVVYGTITKNVTNPKKTTIISVKKDIENSKAFLDSLKKAKGDIECKVTPTVTAKKKGIASAYKGIFASVDDAISSDKAISYIPAKDGRIYELRKNKVGAFIACSDKVSILSEVKAGFIPALPKIPYSILQQVIAFFRSYIMEKMEYEALVYIYWSVQDKEYYVVVPEQKVSANSVDAKPPLQDENNILVMELHSHNTMPAFFSSQDDRDEKKTGLYGVVGGLDKLYPDIDVRVSVGGKYESIPVTQVFEGMPIEFPKEWITKVQTVKFSKAARETKMEELI